MGQCVYLDANAIIHLVNHTDGLEQKDADRLLKLRSSGEIEPVFNVLGFQEQLAHGKEKAESAIAYALPLVFGKLLWVRNFCLNDHVCGHGVSPSSTFWITLTHMSQCDSGNKKKAVKQSGEKCFAFVNALSVQHLRFGKFLLGLGCPETRPDLQLHK